MRYIVIGAGAVGGTIGARLFQAGHDVVLVARGAHHDALVADGLTFATPEETTTLRIPTVAGPDELTLQADDVLLLSVKVQDASPVLDLWARQPVGGHRTAGQDLPVFCVQNGVDGERMALRRFARVYGVCVMLPASHLEPGRIAAGGSPISGILTLGRYPAGADELLGLVSADLTSARFAAPVSETVMRWKYAKLLKNLGNALEVLVGSIRDEAGELLDRAVAEGRSVLATAEIGYATDEEDALARADLTMVEIPGLPRQGGSTWQSVARGAGSVESAYLSGEIVLLGRLHGVPTPVNETVQRLADQCAAGAFPAGSLTAAEVTRAIVDDEVPVGRRRRRRRDNRRLSATPRCARTAPPRRATAVQAESRHRTACHPALLGRAG